LILLFVCDVDRRHIYVPFYNKDLLDQAKVPVVSDLSLSSSFSLLLLLLLSVKKKKKKRSAARPDLTLQKSVSWPTRGGSVETKR
jgi:hypothetical protein